MLTNCCNSTIIIDKVIIQAYNSETEIFDAGDYPTSPTIDSNSRTIDSNSPTINSNIS